MLTSIFDTMCRVVLGQVDCNLLSEDQAERVIFPLILTLESNGWETQWDSAYMSDLPIRKIFMEIHPDWDWPENQEPLCFL